MPFTFGDEPSNHGESTAVQCMITKGDLPLTIQWSLNNAPIVDKSDGLIVMRMSPRLSSLSIESLNYKHRGQFTCSATNIAGAAEYTSELIVNGITSRLFQFYYFRLLFW